MRVLITGVTGFVGSHFAELALARGADVAGAIRAGSDTERIDHLVPSLRLLECDFEDSRSVRALLETSAPDWIVHLVAQSFVAASWPAPVETFQTNVVSQLNVLEAMRAVASNARSLVVGSSDEYGLVLPEELPVRETNALRPLSPYAVSKVAQDLLGYQYVKSYGLHLVRSRAFNHTGPRRGSAFAESSFARQVAEIEAGHREPVIEVGDLKPRLDFSDVRDIVRGYWLLLERGTPGEVYNLCSGTDWSIESILEFLLERSRVPGISLQVDPTRLRPSDTAMVRGSAEKAATAVGWRPEIPFERTLTDLLDYWRARIRARPR